MSGIPDSLLGAMSELVRQLSPTSLASVLAALQTDTGAQEPDVLAVRPALPLSASNRSAWDKLIGAWRDSVPRVERRVIAGALQAMAWQEHADRNRLSAELVWTGPPLPGHGFRSTEQCVVELIDEALRDVWIVAFAAYRVPALVSALERASMRGVQLSFVVEDADESQGKVAFDPINAFGSTVGAAARSYVWPLQKRPRDARGRYGALHAKCVIVDGKVLFVSSANFTEFAMNLNLELGVVLRSGALAGEAERMLERLVQDGLLVSR